MSISPVAVFLLAVRVLFIMYAASWLVVYQHTENICSVAGGERESVTWDMDGYCRIGGVVISAWIFDHHSR